MHLIFLLNIQCSSACGNGTRTRKITCINAHGVETEASSCDLLTKPKEEEKCVGETCTYKWIASVWSNVILGIEYNIIELIIMVLFSVQ